MAGLVAAARARELGAEPAVYEKGTRAGGSMLLSSGFAWRYRSWEVFREQCPGGDPTLQLLILERFDDALDWLEAQGVELLTRDRQPVDRRRPVRPAATRRHAREGRPSRRDDG